MRSQLFSILALLALQALGRPSRPQRNMRIFDDDDDDDGCPKGVHIIGVRGTLEEPGFGAMDELKERLLKELPDSDAYAIDYPASGITIGDDGSPQYHVFEYIRSVQQGRSAFARELYDFNIYCPKTQVVVMAYSQGAQVAGDAICGSTFPFFPVWDAIEPEYKANVKAFITLGDPRNNATMPKHVGNSTKDGIFPRSDMSNCGDNIISSWRTYCDATDPFCDHGKNMDAHLHYVKDYFDDIVSHVKSKVKASSVAYFGHPEHADAL